MFKITNYSNKIDIERTSVVNNIEDAGDIVFNITSSEEARDTAIRIMNAMHFDDLYSAKLFHITCVRE